MRRFTQAETKFVRVQGEVASPESKGFFLLKFQTSQKNRWTRKEKDYKKRAKRVKSLIIWRKVS